MKRSRRSSRIFKQTEKQTKRKTFSSEEKGEQKLSSELSPKCDSETGAIERTESQTSSSLVKQELIKDDITEQPNNSSEGRKGNVSVEQSTSPTQEKNGPDFFFQDEDGDTYLHIAVVQCNEGLVNFLVQAMKAQKLDIYNNLRQTPLHLAVITGQINLIGLLIKAGCDVNALDRHGQTPLHLACKRGDIDSVRAIFDNISTESDTIDLNAKNFDGFSPLHLATLNGNKSLIGLMIDKGADIDNKDACSGRTPIHHAVEAGRYFIVEYFLSRGASANVTTYAGNTPLHTAAGRHMDDMIKLLSNHGADVNMANMEGDKPKVVHTSEQSKRQLESSRRRAKRPKTSKPSSRETATTDPGPP